MCFYRKRRRRGNRRNLFRLRERGRSFFFQISSWVQTRLFGRLQSAGCYFAISVRNRFPGKHTRQIIISRIYLVGRRWFLKDAGGGRPRRLCGRNARTDVLFALGARRTQTFLPRRVVRCELDSPVCPTFTRNISPKTLRSTTPTTTWLISRAAQNQ